jgi:hypothetical protein
MTHNRHIVLEIRELHAQPVALWITIQSVDDSRQALDHAINFTRRRGVQDARVHPFILMATEITLCGIQSITVSDRIRRPILRLRDPFMIKSTLTPRASLKSC